MCAAAQGHPGRRSSYSAGSDPPESSLAPKSRRACRRSSRSFAVALVGEPVAFMRRFLALMRDLLAKAVDFDPLVRALGASSARPVAFVLTQRRPRAPARQPPRHSPQRPDRGRSAPDSDHSASDRWHSATDPPRSGAVRRRGPDPSRCGGVHPFTAKSLSARCRWAHWPIDVLGTGHVSPCDCRNCATRRWPDRGSRLGTTATHARNRTAAGDVSGCGEAGGDPDRGGRGDCIPQP